MEGKQLRNKIVKRLLKKSKKDLGSFKKFGMEKIEDCVIEVSKKGKKYCCYFNSVYMLLSDNKYLSYNPVKNKRVEVSLKSILNGGCSKAKYIHEVNLIKLRKCMDKYKMDGKTLYTFKFNFGKEEMALNPELLRDCLGFAVTKRIYFNGRLSPVVFKNEGEELKRFGILFPICLNKK